MFFLFFFRLWPQYVKDRIKTTYLYFGGSIGISVASAAAVFRTPAVLNFFARGGMVSMFVSLGAMIGSGMLLQSIPYEPGFGPKQMAWIANSALIGAVFSTLGLLGGPLLIRAGWYTAGIVGGLSTVAACAPSEKFLTMGGPLAIGFGVVFASSIGELNNSILKTFPILVYLTVNMSLLLQEHGFCRLRLHSELDYIQWLSMEGFSCFLACSCMIHNALSIKLKIIRLTTQPYDLLIQ